jgi:hypothetical protein
MLTRGAAEEIARAKLAEIEAEVGMPLVLVEDAVIERDIAFAFSYNSREYIETGRFSAALAGNGSIIVVRKSGEVLEGGTAEPVEFYLNNLERYGRLFQDS